MRASIGALFVYPVKSCGGIHVDSAVLTQRGLLYDREWMIVEATGNPARFLTQREIPRLALVETALTKAGLTLAAAGMESITVDFGATGAAQTVVIWRDTVSALDQGEQVAQWLSTLVGRAVRLVRFEPNFRRWCNPQYAGEGVAHTAFADGYPLLVVGGQSLADLNRRLIEQGTVALPMNRFRPNLVVDGIEAYDEDHMRTLTLGETVLRLVKPCVRCQITTTDQATAQVGVEPLLTFAGYRSHDALGGVTFGMNAIVAAGAGSTLACGAALEVDWAF
ncbi:MAG: MOSC N-terminal beta barrel domain-containing protein [Betaproteobacteria bacterium]